MSIIREDILSDIDYERHRQTERWSTEFDKLNTANDWGQYINQYVAKAATLEIGASADYRRENLVKVAALAVAAIEVLDRYGDFAPRHFEVK